MCLFGAELAIGSFSAATVTSSVAAAATLLQIAGGLYAGATAAGQGQAAEAQSEVDAAAENIAARDRAKKIRKLGRLQAGAARSALAASGIQVGGVGTPLVIDREIAQSVEDDAWAEILTGQSRAAALRREGQLLAEEGESQLYGSLIGAGATLLGSAGEAEQKDRWKRMADEGTGP